MPNGEESMFSRQLNAMKSFEDDQHAKTYRFEISQPEEPSVTVC